MCACGAINLGEMEKCYKCGNEYEKLINSLNEEYLSQRIEERIKKEREEREQEEKKKKNKTKKIVGVVIAACALIILGVALFIGLDYSNYTKAVKLYNAGEYDEALDVLAKLKIFDGTSYTRSIYQEKNYQEAISYENSGDYNSAIESFSLCGDYKDARDRMQFALAIQKLESGEILEAKDIINTLSSEFKESNPEVDEYLDLITQSIDSGWGGIWCAKVLLGISLDFIYTDLIIKDKELYVRFNYYMTDEDVLKENKTEMGYGKVEGNKVYLSLYDKNMELISYKELHFGGLEYIKAKDVEGNFVY